MEMTITEALAEIKTINKRIEKKREFVALHVLRQEMVRDPLEKQGGSVEALRAESQATSDLLERLIQIRSAIQMKNMITSLTIGNQTRTITGWLTWRKEVAPGVVAFNAKISGHIESNRQQLRTKGIQVGQASAELRAQDIVVNIDEKKLAADAEELYTILGTLDGRLSLLNATTMIDVY